MQSISYQDLPHDQLMACVRAGDAAALAEIRRRTMAVVRPAASISLNDQRLRSRCDTSDVLQDVYLRFFLHCRGPNPGLPTLEDVQRYLRCLARHRLHDLRSTRLDTTGEPRERPLPSGQLTAQPAPDPDDSCHDDWELVRRHMSAPMVRLAEMRAEGWTWEEIGTMLGENGASLRRAFDRACAAFRRTLAGCSQP